jgi:predicted DNA-binding protein (UPF0251 family)
MPRCRKKRCCRELGHGGRVFKPRAVPFDELEEIRLGLDEFEALRLCDLEDHDQESAGQVMGVSRGTVQRLLKRGRKIVIGALLHRQALVIRDEPERDES